MTIIHQLRIWRIEKIVICEQFEYGAVQKCVTKKDRTLCNYSSEYFLAIIGFDKAENEPSNICYESLTPYNYNAWIPYFQSIHSETTGYEDPSMERQLCASITLWA